jgi:hypothetical protein
MKLIRATIDFASGKIFCEALAPVGQVFAPVQFSLSDAELTAAAQAAGRPDWSNADLVNAAQSIVGVVEIPALAN